MSKYLFFSTLLVAFILILSCQPGEPDIMMERNPPAEGFNEENSDPMAIAIADSVMSAMGGRKAWDDTRYIKWNFFGARRHIWDKHTNEVVIEGLRDTFNIKMNLDSMIGEVNYHGIELTPNDSLDKYLQRGWEMWVNDSYWLVMPYKLKDSGVTLKYNRVDTTMNGLPAHVLELTFQEVGVTPKNKYAVYVDTLQYLVRQWDFFTNATDTLPRFSTPWDGYGPHGTILLSGDRGGGRKITEIAVGDSLAIYFQ